LDTDFLPAACGFWNTDDTDWSRIYRLRRVDFGTRMIRIGHGFIAFGVWILEHGLDGLVTDFLPAAFSEYTA